VFLDAVAHGSVIPWQYINLPGEYDFSDENLPDRPSKNIRVTKGKVARIVPVRP
jgi:hypothetical protein